MKVDYKKNDCDPHHYHWIVGKIVSCLDEADTGIHEVHDTGNHFALCLSCMQVELRLWKMSQVGQQIFNKNIHMGFHQRP